MASALEFGEEQLVQGDQRVSRRRKAWAAATICGALCLMGIVVVLTRSAAGGVRASRNTLAEGGADSTNSTSEKVVDDGTDGACEWPVVPTKIILKEQIWAFLQTVTVGSEDEKDSLGYVQSSPFAWDTEQVWYDKRGKALAYSRHKWAQTSSIFFRDTVHVEDCNKRDMGVISDDLVSSGLSEVNMLTVELPDGKIIATSTAQDSDNKVNIIDAETRKKVASVTHTKGWGPSGTWQLYIDPVASAAGNLAADPRMLVLALAAESSSVAWGFGALGWICFMGFFVGICVCLCIHMMRNADPKDPRYGILAVFDREGDRYESIPSAVPVGTGAGRAAAVAQAQPQQGVAPTSGTSAFQGQGQRLGHT